MKELTIIKVKLLLKEFDKCSEKSITYDWDGGHCYSIIKSDVYNKMMEVCQSNDLEDLEYEVNDHCNQWLYEYDECPPCAIHINKDGSVGSSCGCHDDDHTSDEHIQDAIVELIKLEKDYGPYLITVYDSVDFT
jgi:hypothetical protein